MPNDRFSLAAGSLSRRRLLTGTVAAAGLLAAPTPTS